MKAILKRTIPWMLMCMVWIMSVLPVCAGDINSSEQSVIDASEGPFNYNGREYVPSDSARDQLEDYLEQDDVDLTPEQAREVISRGRASIAEGVEKGYLVPADGQEPSTEQGAGGEESPSQPPAETQPSTQAQPSAAPQPSTQAQSSQETMSSAETETSSAAEPSSGESPEPSRTESVESMPESSETEGESSESIVSENEVRKLSTTEKDFKGGIDVFTIAIVIVILIVVAGVAAVMIHKNRFKKR